MLQFYKKQSLIRWCRSPIVIGLLLILCVLLAGSVYERYTIEREMAERRALVEMEVEELEARRDALQERVEYLSNERGIEAEMRRNFDVARPGEEVIIILDEAAAATDIQPVGGPVPEEDERPWYQFW